MDPKAYNWSPSSKATAVAEATATSTSYASATASAGATVIATVTTSSSSHTKEPTTISKAAVPSQDFFSDPPVYENQPVSSLFHLLSSLWPLQTCLSHNLVLYLPFLLTIRNLRPLKILVFRTSTVL